MISTHKIPASIKILIAILLLLFMPIMLRGVGIYLGEPGWKVAEIAAKKRNINICNRIFALPWEVTKPSSRDRQRLCIHDYARLKKDPTACELLMPSRYGLSCVGGAMDNKDCFMGSKYTVRGNGINTSIQECIDGPDTIRTNACCIIALTSAVKSINNCSRIDKESEYYDACLYMLSFSNRDPTTCTDIQKPNVQAACLIATKALQQKPSICQGCRLPVDSIEDLPSR